MPAKPPAAAAVPLHVQQVRVQQGQKLRALYRAIGWSRADCAKFLQVTERCLRNWETGRHRLPVAVLKLMRLHLRYELPGKDWQGWRICGGKLITPEGHALSPHDAKWWALLVRRAEVGSDALRRLAQMKRPSGGADTGGAHPSLRGGATPGAAMPDGARPQASRRAAPLDLSTGHFGTSSPCSRAAHGFGWRPSPVVVYQFSTTGEPS